MVIYMEMSSKFRKVHTDDLHSFKKINPHVDSYIHMTKVIPTPTINHQIFLLQTCGITYPQRGDCYHT